MAGATSSTNSPQATNKGQRTGRFHSARACARVLRMARTIADMEGRQRIDTTHLAEAVSLRVLDRG